MLRNLLRVAGLILWLGCPLVILLVDPPNRFSTLA
jgi:hypothetical protein